MSSIDEEKIEKLNDINNSIKRVKRMCDEIKSVKASYDVMIDIRHPNNPFTDAYMIKPIDIRMILIFLLIQKEELENEIKGDIKNER